MVVEGDEGATPSPDFPGEKVGLGSWRAGRPPDLFGWGEQYRGARSSGFCGTRSGRRRIFELPQGFNARGSWRAGRPPDLFGGKKAVPECKFPASAGRGQGGGEYSNLREKMIVGGAGGPGALQTSPPVRSQESVDTNPHAALAGLTCRASPANSSSFASAHYARGASLDSVRLRRNRSLLLCGTQSSSLTCARGADRA